MSVVGNGWLRASFLLLPIVLVAGAVRSCSGTVPDVQKAQVLAAAREYADAWKGDRLADIGYDPLSSPDVQGGDPQLVAENVAWITRRLELGGPEVSPVPTDVSVDTADVAVDSGSDSHLATATMHVTWTLHRSGLGQAGRAWSYTVPLQLHRTDGPWRVVWSPAAVHPQVKHGIVLELRRQLAPRATLLGANDTPLPPPGQPALARVMLGQVTANATHEQAETAPLRAVDGDAVGLTGLESQFDERLAGDARLEVRGVVVPGYTGIAPLNTPLYVSPPEAPRPLKLTLDPRVQSAAETATAGTRSKAAVVVVRVSTGDVLAAANANTTDNLALSGQYPPGPVFSLAPGLAYLRAQHTLQDAVDCSEPYTLDGQVFRNRNGAPRTPGISLSNALAGGCTTGLIRQGETIDAAAVQKAAYDLGYAVNAGPATGDADRKTPDEASMGDLLGTPAFHGRVPSEGTARQHAEDIGGAGRVLTSPLALARTAATVASGGYQGVKFVLDPAPRQGDRPTPTVSADELRPLQNVMGSAVTEAGGTANALEGATGGNPHALAGAATYGTGQTSVQAAWCVGYRGDYAFAVLVPEAATTAGTTPATDIAKALLARL